MAKIINESTDREAELRNELKKIANLKHKQMIAEYHPVFVKKYVGKYFKIRNRYSSGKAWWLYVAVTEIKPSDVYDTNGNGVTSHYQGWSFQTCGYGHINIEKREHGYIHSLEKEITETEFNEAYNKMIDSINAFGGII